MSLIVVVLLLSPRRHPARSVLLGLSDFLSYFDGTSVDAARVLCRCEICKKNTKGAWKPTAGLYGTRMLAALQMATGFTFFVRILITGATGHTSWTPRS